MKMIKLSEKILKFMVTQYKNKGTECFSFNSLKSAFPDNSDDFLSKAIYLLQDDGFVRVMSADNVAYLSTLLPKGIRHCEENTILKKWYAVLKEIKTLFQ